jgi:hypothetical protein
LFFVNFRFSEEIWNGQSSDFQHPLT